MHFLINELMFSLFIAVFILNEIYFIRVLQKKGFALNGTCNGFCTRSKIWDRNCKLLVIIA